MDPKVNFRSHFTLSRGQKVFCQLKTYIKLSHPIDSRTERERERDFAFGCLWTFYFFTLFTNNRPGSSINCRWSAPIETFLPGLSSFPSKKLKGANLRVTKWTNWEATFKPKCNSSQSQLRLKQLTDSFRMWEYVFLLSSFLVTSPNIQAHLFTDSVHAC